MQMKSKVLAFLLATVVAFGLWLYVITVVNPESEKTYYEIPVVLQNKEILAERGLMIVGESPKVTLALKGKRTTLNILNEANINVIINVANIEKPGTHHLTYDISYPGNVSKNEISVLSSSTDLITVKVEKKIKKTIPVVVDDGGTSVPDGFIAVQNDIYLDRPSIEAYGPESVMQHIHQAVIEVDLTGQTKTLIKECQYTLCNKEGVPVNASGVITNAEEVTIRIKIHRLKEISLVVEIIDGGGATQQTSTIKIDPQKIWVSGEDQLLENLNELVIYTLDLAETPEDTTLTVEIKMPEGVTNQTGVKQATVRVDVPELMTKAFNVTTITAINVSEGMIADIITRAQSVTVRGPADVVETMKDTHISLVVDFSKVQPGMHTLEASVVISDAFPGVGAMDTYQITATLRVPETEPEPDPMSL